MPKKGQTVSPEMRARISAALRGRPSANRGRAPSVETREKLAAANRGKKASEATKAKMRAAQALRPSPSAEVKAKISAAAMGRKHSDATRLAMSLAKKGRPGRKLTDAEKAALRAANLGRVASAEAREKMRQAKLGSAGHWLGKKRGALSDEWREKISEGNRGKVMSTESREKIRASLIGRVKTPEVIERIKAGLVGKVRVGPANNRWGKPPPHGKRIRYAGICFRSTYEVAFAKLLDSKGIKWEYEPRRFDLGSCTYLPDFFLPETGEFWEVKGWLTPNCLRRMGLFRELFPDIPLMLATKPVLKEMGAFRKSL